jgi:hypothetical protein
MSQVLGRKHKTEVPVEYEYGLRFEGLPWAGLPSFYSGQIQLPVRS